MFFFELSGLTVLLTKSKNPPTAFAIFSISLWFSSCFPRYPFASLRARSASVLWTRDSKIFSPKSSPLKYGLLNE